MFWNTGITRKNENKLFLLFGVMLSAILLPSFPIQENLPRLRLDEILIFGTFAVNMLIFIRRGFRFDVYGWGMHDEKKRAAVWKINTVFLLLIGSYLLSNLYGVLIMHTVFGVRDIMELVTYAKYYLVITLAAGLDVGESERTMIRRVFLAGFFLTMILSWGQYLNLAYMNSWLTPLLAPAHLNNLVDANPPRVLGTFDNPNVMGIFAVITLTLAVTWFYFHDSGRRTAAALLLLCGLTVKLAFLTISRTALLGAAAVLVVLSLWSLFKFRWNRIIVLKAALLFILTMTVFFTSPREFTMRMSEATDIQKSTSAIGHIFQWREALEVVKQSPVFGWGTGKTEMTTAVDNEYILILRRYGAVGFLTYLWFFIKPVAVASRRLRNSENYFAGAGYTDASALLAIAFMGATVAVFIYNLTAGLFYNLQIMTLFAIFMGLIYNPER
ncbi:MAG: O-antigen ligase family protein [Peptococcaceae bacterium]|jgi:O-antigen ligase|nr:O-antigen ligase family protein [Peptococcaceae bacterium]